MPTEILIRFRDAMGMFWDSLTSEEKRYMLYVGVYLGVTVIAAASKKSSERNKQQMLSEVRAMIESRDGVSR